MAIYKLFPEKDATLYTQNTNMNTGLDEILEASTYLLDDSAQTSRYLIKFSQNEINSAYTSYISGSGISYLTLDNALASPITENPTDLVNRTYLNVPFTSSTGNGVGAYGNITTAGNTISSIILTNRGKNYKAGDILLTTNLSQSFSTNGRVSQTTGSITLSSVDFKKRKWGANLKNYAAVVTNLNSTSYLKVYPISQSWDMGTGRFGNSPVTQDGCNWGERKTGINWTNGTFNIRTTGSYSQNQGTSVGGGTWHTGSSTAKIITSSQTFTYADSIDLDVDVTFAVDVWFSQSNELGGDIPNEGFIIKQTSSVELIPSQSQASTFKFYSVDTNTIYPPTLEIKFDDFFYGTSSQMQTLYQPEAFISSYNNDGVYYPQSVQRFRIAAVPQYPKKIFQTASGYLTNYYLPKQAEYAIKDSETNEYVINFDSEYTKVSADTTSSYFDIYMGGLEPERYYTVLLKTTINGTTKVFDEDIMFKVING
jgi:hypothetical protein|tara:strand:- start:1824 stop:3269 length:1446 start_codon:yes stop_codon:yes gene_type:complete